MKKLVFFLFLTIPFIALSQNLNQDLGLWTKVNLNYKINKKLNFTNKTELRTVDNSRQISQYYTQFSIKKKFDKIFYSSIAWRIKVLNQENANILVNRFHNDLVFKKKISNLSMYVRLRTQVNFHPIKTNEIIERTRLKLKYKINKKISYFIYNELYFLINPETKYNYNKNRFGSGFEYSLNKKIGFEIKYLKINNLNTENPSSLNVFGIKAVYQL
tara:strand:+ start:320 stop:967 length:648 start_codon:yes stop_codon:yes gene_type:complete